MPVSVNLQTVHPRKLAAVRREVAPGAVGSTWGPALGKVWEFIRSQPGMRTDGHNIFLYHHPIQVAGGSVVRPDGRSRVARPKFGPRLKTSWPTRKEPSARRVEDAADVENARNAVCDRLP